MRRWAVVIALSAIVVASTAAALQVPESRSRIGRRSLPRAAVLSLRRTPQLLSDLVAGQRLGAALDKVLQDPDLGSGEACLVVSSRAGVLYRDDADRQLAPASTLKLLTAAVALTRLPADGFATRVVARKVDGGTVAGDVWLVGGGDPLLASRDYQASFPDQPRRFTDMDALADTVVAKGIRRIEGRVLGDDSRFDGERYLPSWKLGYRASGNMGALSALAFNDGFVSWRPRPFSVSPEPAAYAASALIERLRARGVAVAGDGARGTAPSGAAVLASVPSLPLKEIVGEMLTHSDNETAELLTKSLGGATPTTAAGVSVIRSALVDMGYDVSGLAASDGSGLDTGDRTTCSLLHAVLTQSSREKILSAGLAIAGQTGTLFDRFRAHPAAGRLKAKTGALEGVVGLAGVVEPHLTFVFLANGLPAPSDARGKRVQERLGAALAAYPDAPSPDSLAP